MRQNNGNHNPAGLLGLLDDLAAAIQSLANRVATVALGSGNAPGCAGPADIGKLYFEPSGSGAGLYACQASNGTHQYTKL